MQTNYSFSPDLGVPGGLYDLTDHVVDTYNNEADDGDLKFGMGVVLGTGAGKAALPTSSATINDFEGVLLNGGITEHTMGGEVCVLKGKTLGVLKQGRIWARVTEDSVPVYGKPALLVVNGTDTGCFTTDDDEDNAANVIAVNAKFLGGKGTGDVAPVEVYPTVIVAPAAAAAASSEPEQGTDPVENTETNPEPNAESGTGTNP